MPAGGGGGDCGGGELAAEATVEAMIKAMKEATINPMNPVMAILMDMSISIVSTFYVDLGFLK